MTDTVTGDSPSTETNAETVEAQADTVTATPEDANAAQSSGADNEDAKQEPQSLRDVIQNVVTKAEAPEESSTPEAKEDTVDPEAKAEGEGDDPEAQVPFHNHPRFKQVLQERDSFKADAEQYRNITEFMASNQLKAEEVAEGFEVMALLKSPDPANLSKVRDWFAERLQYLDTTLGHKLPDDLQNEVEGGYLTEERARELSQARAAKTLLETQTAERQQQDRQRDEEQSRRETTQVMVSAVTQWEVGVKAKDPDFAAKKEPLVRAQVAALIQERGRRPSSPEEAVEFAQTAYDRVNEAVKAMLPKPKAMTPPVSGLSATARPEPKSLREAVEGALR